MAGRQLARRRLRRVVVGVLMDEKPMGVDGGRFSKSINGDGGRRANDGEEQREMRRVLAAYRMYVFENGEARAADPGGRGERRGMTKQEVDAVIRVGGKLGFFEAVRCRVRYFTDGCVLGCRAFVEGVFERNRERFGSGRGCGARELRGVELPWLFTVRDLRREAVQGADPGG